MLCFPSFFDGLIELVVSLKTTGLDFLESHSTLQKTILPLFRSAQ